MEENIPEELVEAGRGYESLFVTALFEKWTRHLIEGASVQQGSHVLDLACGTGILARNALPRTAPFGRVVGVDPAPGMLAAAQEIEPNIDWVLSSAEFLELADEIFDCVVSQFGMMFFEDRQKSAYDDIIAVLQEQVGTAAADALRLPYSLGNTQEVTAVLVNSDFTSVGVESAKFPSSRNTVEAELRGWLPLFDILLSEAKINDVLIESDKTLSKYAGPSGEAIFPTSAHVITVLKN